MDEAPGLEGVGDVADNEAARDGDRRREHLAEKLLARREREAVVKKARAEDDHEGGDEGRVVDVELGRGNQDDRPAPVHGTNVLHGKGGDDAAEDGDAPHARHGALVDSAGIGIVDRPATDGETLRKGRHEQGRCEGGGEKAQIWYQIWYHYVPSPLSSPHTPCHDSRNLLGAKRPRAPT